MWIRLCCTPCISPVSSYTQNHNTDKNRCLSICLLSASVFRCYANIVSRMRHSDSSVYTCTMALRIYIHVLVHSISIWDLINFAGLRKCCRGLGRQPQMKYLRYKHDRSLRVVIIAYRYGELQNKSFPVLSMQTNYSVIFFEPLKTVSGSREQIKVVFPHKGIFFIYEQTLKELTHKVLHIQQSKYYLYIVLHEPHSVHCTHSKVK